MNLFLCKLIYWWNYTINAGDYPETNWIINKQNFCIYCNYNTYIGLYQIGNKLQNCWIDCSYIKCQKISVQIVFKAKSLNNIRKCKVRKF